MSNTDSSRRLPKPRPPAKALLVAIANLSYGIFTCRTASTQLQTGWCRRAFDAVLVGNGGRSCSTIQSESQESQRCCRKVNPLPRTWEGWEAQVNELSAGSDAPWVEEKNAPHQPQSRPGAASVRRNRYHRTAEVGPSDPIKLIR